MNRGHPSFFFQRHDMIAQRRLGNPHLALPKCSSSATALKWESWRSSMDRYPHIVGAIVNVSYIDPFGLS